MISCDRLTKSFGPTVAVFEASFAVPTGSICALLGPNGAGKSTLVKMLTGLLTPSGGTAEVNGLPVSSGGRTRLARLQGILGVLKAIALLSWRNVRSLQSTAGQNLFLVVVLVALGQPESAAFFAVVLVVVLLFPLSSDPIDAVPTERRLGWRLNVRDWTAIRLGAFALTPAAWLALFIVLRSGWRTGGLMVAFAALLQLITFVIKRFASGLSTAWMH